MSFSFAPSDAVQGGLPSNIDVRVKEARTEIFTYPNSGEQAAALTVVYEPLDGSNSFEQTYSAGSPSRIKPTEDGESFEAASPDVSLSSLTNSTNCYVFMAALVAASFPEDKLKDFKASSLVGLEGHVVRKAQPKREGSLPTEKAQEVLVFTKIITLPWEKTKGKGKGKGAAASTTSTSTTSSTSSPAAAANGAGNLSDAAQDAVKEALSKLLVAAPDNTLPLSSVRIGLFNSLPNLKVAEKNGALVLLKDQEWLAAAGIASDGNSITLLAGA